MNQRDPRMSDRRIPILGAIGLALVAAINLFWASLAVCSSDTTKDTIIEEWDKVRIPPPPELKAITVDPKVTALLILDIQNSNCNPERRPRCVATLPSIQSLLAAARQKKMPVIYTLTRGASETDIRKELSPLAGEPIVKSGVDKFFMTDLENILKSRGIETVILVGTSAHGAVLHTATGAAQRGLKVIVPVDGMSSDDLYAEQYTCWHLVNSPGTRRETTLTRIGLITF
jgi:nicotinamidase-related amidase